jgi:hypothetical protein
MVRLLVAACVLVLAACGGTTGSKPSVAGPPSAQSVGSNSSDFAGVQKCPQSGSWDSFLKAIQTTDPTTYESQKSELNALKAAGADDTYVAVYADSSSTCNAYSSSAPPSGRAVIVYTIRFKNESAASADYKTNTASFHLSDSDTQNIKAAGGTVTQGSATGLGPNSVVASISLQGASIYTALWQNKEFEVVMVAANMPAADAEAGTKKINGRIH